MSYIGSKPADKVLTASDITDGIVSNAKLAQDIMSAEIISCASLAFVIIPSATSELVKGAAVGIFPI